MTRLVQARRLACGPALLWCALLAAATNAQAQTDDATSVTGSLRMDYFSASKALDGVNNVVSATGQMKVKHALASDQRLEAEAQFIQRDVFRGGGNDIRWISGYWFSRYGPVNLRVGQQKLRWGKADGVNPTDFFTPVDFVVPLPLEEDRYLSIPAVRADVQLDDDKTLTLVLEPSFNPSRLPGVPAPVALDDDRPNGWHNPQVGARLSRTGENLDWSLSAFHGYSTLPVLSFAGAAGGLPQYERYYPRSNGLGADVASSLGEWGVRAELAYTTYSREPNRQGVAPNYFLVAGVDRSFVDWNINVQALYRYIPDFEQTTSAANAGQAFAAAYNGVVYNEQQRSAVGMTARVSASWLHSTLQTELLYVAYFNPTNSLLRPLLSYAVSDTQKLVLGGDYYSGPDISFFGAFKKGRGVFMEFQQFL